jgi:polysaccharide export outer membrane protein
MATRASVMLTCLLLGACSGGVAGMEPFTASPRPTAEFPNIAYADWTDFEPEYRLYPGDLIDMRVPSAPELNRERVRVGPDGRIALPLGVYLMAADRSIAELEADAAKAYASQLHRPDVNFILAEGQPMKVYVGGEVGTPGQYDMAGDIDALQAVIQAGGFEPGARRSQVVVIRRGPEGKPMMRTVNLARAVNDPARGDAAPLRRFDIVYVPRSTAAEVGLFMTQIFAAVPFASGFSYALADRLVRD